METRQLVIFFTQDLPELLSPDCQETLSMSMMGRYVHSKQCYTLFGLIIIIFLFRQAI